MKSNPLHRSLRHLSLGLGLCGVGFAAGLLFATPSKPAYNPSDHFVEVEAKSVANAKGPLTVFVASVPWLAGTCSHRIELHVTQDLSARRLTAESRRVSESSRKCYFEPAGEIEGRHGLHLPPGEYHLRWRSGSVEDEYRVIVGDSSSRLVPVRTSITRLKRPAN